ncbi:MAG: nucleotidyltransferase domain-containing protein, partial [Candidatus Micrarchaeota archaeon]
MDTLLRILEVFFENPLIERNAREVSLKSGLAYGTCYNHLHKLVKGGLFSLQRKGQAGFLMANLQNSELLKYFEMLELRRTKSFFEKRGREYLMLEKVLQNQGGIEFSAVFGSFARKQHVENSDIDLLLVGDKGKFEKRVIGRCKDFGITKGREINPVFASV